MLTFHKDFSEEVQQQAIGWVVEQINSLLGSYRVATERTVYGNGDEPKSLTSIKNALSLNTDQLREAINRVLQE